MKRAKKLNNTLLHKAAILVIGIILFLGCSKVPIIGRKQFRLLPESMMLALSLENYNAFLSQNPKLPDNRNEVKLVRKIGNRIAHACENLLKAEGYQKRLKTFQWEFNVVDQNVANAWCMPGGKVVVYTGILPYTETEDELAVVMGHEIAHAVARHGSERMSQQLAVLLGGMSLSVAMKEKPEEVRNLFLAAYGVSAQLGVLAYSRKHETEADKLGLIFAAKAGYNPEAAISFWKRMSSSGGPNIPQFLSTHPSHEKRIKDLEEFMPTALSYYEPYNGE